MSEPLLHGIGNTWAPIERFEVDVGETILGLDPDRGACVVCWTPEGWVDHFTGAPADPRYGFAIPLSAVAPNTPEQERAVAALRPTRKQLEFAEAYWARFKDHGDKILAGAA